MSLKSDLKYLLKTRTQKECAAILGVSERTIRRWKNEGTTPLPKNRARIPVVVSEQKEFVKVLPKRRKTVKAVKPIRLVKDLGHSQYFDVQNHDDSEIVAVMAWIRDHSPLGYPPLCRFVIEIPIGGTSPGGREFKQGGYYSSQIFSLEHATSAAKLESIIKRENTHGKIKYVVRLLPVVAKPQQKKKRRR